MSEKLAQPACGPMLCGGESGCSFLGQSPEADPVICGIHLEDPEDEPTES